MNPVSDPERESLRTCLRSVCSLEHVPSRCALTMFGKFVIVMRVWSDVLDLGLTEGERPGANIYEYEIRSIGEFREAYGKIHRLINNHMTKGGNALPN